MYFDIVKLAPIQNQPNSLVFGHVVFKLKSQWNFRMKNNFVRKVFKNHFSSMKSLKERNLSRLHQLEFQGHCYTPIFGRNIHQFKKKCMRTMCQQYQNTNRPSDQTKLNTWRIVFKNSSPKKELLFPASAFENCMHTWSCIDIWMNWTLAQPTSYGREEMNDTYIHTHEQEVEVFPQFWQIQTFKALSLARNQQYCLFRFVIFYFFFFWYWEIFRPNITTKVLSIPDFCPCSR